MPGVEFPYEDTRFSFAQTLGGEGFYTPTPEACQTECEVRDSICHAWTFIQGTNNTANEGLNTATPYPKIVFPTRRKKRSLETQPDVDVTY